MKTTIGIARISVEERADSRQLYTQLESLRKSGADVLFYDIASRTADLADRPGLQKAIEAINGGTVERVLVTRLDRLTANQSLFEYFKNICDKHKVEILDLTLQLDLNSPIGELLASIQVATAKYEVRNIRQRINARTKRDSENYESRRVPFGFCKIKGKTEQDTKPFLCLIDGRKELSKVEIAKHQIEVLKQTKSFRATVGIIHDFYGVSESLPGTRKEPTNVLESDQIDSFLYKRKTVSAAFRWSDSGFTMWFRSPVLSGYSVTQTFEIIETDEGKQVRKKLPHDQWKTKKTHTGIIDNSERLDLLQAIAAKTRKPRTTGYIAEKNIYRLLVKCAECGGNAIIITSSNKKGNNFYYQCSTYDRERYKRKANKDAVLSCYSSKSCKIEKIDAAVIAKLTLEATHLVELTKLGLPKGKDVEDSPEVTELKQQIRQLESIGDSDLVDFINKKRLKLQQLQLQASEKTNQRRNYDSLLVQCFRDSRFWGGLTSEERREFCFALIDKILIKDGDVLDVILK